MSAPDASHIERARLEGARSAKQTMKQSNITQPATDAGNPLDLSGAFKLLSQIARSDENGKIGDFTGESELVNRCRAAFTQVRGQLSALEESFEESVATDVARLRQEIASIENRGRN